MVRTAPVIPRLYTAGPCSEERFQVYQARANDPVGNEVSMSFRRCLDNNRAAPVPVKYWIVEGPVAPMGNDLCIRENHQNCDGCCRTNGMWPANQRELTVRNISIFGDDEIERNGAIKNLYIQTGSPENPEDFMHHQSRSVTFQVRCQ